MENIRETLIALSKKSDFDIYMEKLDRDISAHKLDKAKKEEIVKNSMTEAIECYEKLVKDYGELTPIKYAIKLNVPIVYVKEKPTKYYAYLGLFTEKNQTITLNIETIDFVKDLANQYNICDLVDIDSLKNTVTAHELFHYLELVNPELYSNQKIIDGKIFGLFKTKSQLLAAGEISAMHFAKLVTKLRHSPLLYDKVFVLGKKQLF